MKTYFTKLSSILFLGLTLLTASIFTSCSNDDNVPYVIPTFSGTVESVTFDEVTIDPQLNIANAVYRWKDNTSGTILSNEQVLKYTYNTPGTRNLILIVEQGNSHSYYTYKVDVAKSYNYNYITLDLSTFNLANGLNKQGVKYGVRLILIKYYYNIRYSPSLTRQNIQILGMVLQYLM